MTHFRDDQPADPQAENRVIEEFKAVISQLRNTWRSCLTPTGRRKFGPAYYAITKCDDTGCIGMTSAKHPKGKRWACKTCVGFAAPIWSDVPDACPTTDEALHEYTEWGMGLSQKSEAYKQRIAIKRILR